MKILGIDPGLNITGYGVIEARDRRVVLIEGGAIRSGPAEDGLQVRLSRLYDGIVELLDHFGPQALALEQLYAHYEHPTTAILMGHARGVICLAATKRDVPVFDYASTQIKSLLAGNGRASKEQMQRAIQSILNLNKIPQPHDVADALAVAICHHWMVSSPVVAAMGGSQRVGHQ